MTDNKKTSLSAAVRHHLDKWLQRYPADQKRSGVFEALRLVQEENGGWLTRENMDAVADYLAMPNAAVYEVVSFYSLYNTHPVGRHQIDVCTNISCLLNGSEDILAYFKKRLQIDVNETTGDRLFTLREVECLGACANAPVCQIGKKYYENLTPEKIDILLTDEKWD